jgi:TRAP-type uncharacterized transport system substrate-binding protein
MNSNINLYFLLFLIFIYYLYKNRSVYYNNQLHDSSEGFYGGFSETGNPLNINFLEKNADFRKKNLLKLETTIDRNIPILITNFKYSLEYKLGYEISRQFKIKFQESSGLKNNLRYLGVENYNNLVLCSELDYIKIQNPQYQFVCSFYPLYFFTFVRIEHNIDNWLDIKNYHLNVELYEEKGFTNLPTKLRVGIPNRGNNSYNDAKNLFNFIGFNIEDESSDINFVFDTEKSLFNKLKLPITNQNAIDVIYLTSSYKNPYLEEYMKSNNINLIGIEGLNENIIKATYGSNNIFKKKIDNKKFTDIVKKKNIYNNLIGNNVNGDSVFNNNRRIKLFRNSKEEKIIGSKFTYTYASRLILIANKNLDREYVKLLLRNIYGSLDIIKNRLNNYLLNRGNYLEDCLEPYEMAYCPESMEYHPGAFDFFKEINILADEESIRDNIFEKENRKNLFSKLL